MNDNKKDSDMLKNSYGHFDSEQREYVITRPDTPRPWFNYMWNSRYGGLISHTGGGFSFLDSPRDNRINRMRYNSLPWDRPGRYVLLKDADTGEHWSLSWAPTMDRPYDHYECRHGMGYTRINTLYREIDASILYFVPVDLNTEVWTVRLRNTGTDPKNLQIYAFTELLMGNALNDLINQPNDKHFTDIHFDPDLQALLATRRYWVLNKGVTVKQPNLAWPHVVSFGSTLPVSAFDASLDAFIGRWRSEANPIAVEKGQMGNTEITAGDPVAALQHILTLQPGEEVRFSIHLTVHERKDLPTLKDRWTRFQNQDFWDEEFRKLNQLWDQRCAAVSVQSPDPAFNESLNTWNLYQAYVTFDMARNAGYYHGGLLFGTGMRDQFQDILAVLIAEPERVRERLLNALRFQFADGSTLHNFFKLTDTGERTHHSDTPLWIPFGLVWYLRETADISILDEKVAYYDGGEGRVEEHLHRALDYALSETTERGLPKIMNGDWNDTLDHIGPLGKGETVWGAFFLGYVLDLAVELYEQLGRSDKSERYRSAYETLKKKTNDLAWDGEWYLRAFRDNGKPIGSSKDDEGKIFLNAQSWALISGFADGTRSSSLLNAAEKYLLKAQGMQICWPSFTVVDDSVGLISRCVPGKKENGAVFNHASSWFVLAALLAGRNDLAWSVYSRMLPANISADPDRYETEPYVFSEYVTSPDHPTEGQASHSWLTGSAVWMYRIGLDHICGVQPRINGLFLRPALPDAWPRLDLKRVFRGRTLNISVQRSPDSSPGIILNGRTLSSDWIPFEELKDVNEIHVRI